MGQLLFIGGLGMQELLFISLIVLLFFGGKKIPELMKGLGKGVKSFKDGMNGIDSDTKEDEVTKAEEPTKGDK
ncbi:MAG: Sec-independent protein translocase subunit TatA/TatB [Bacteroidales bacterium]